MSDDAAKNLYDSIAERKGEQNAFAFDPNNGRINRAVDIILNEGFPREGVVLDIGGATGNFGYAVANTPGLNFHTRWTLDIVEACREPAEKKGNNFIRANVDVDGFVEKEKGFAGGGIIDAEIDLIVALDFIEHILDPKKFARECFRTLRPGGKVLVNTPNIQYWRHLESLVIQGQFPHTSGDREVYHGGHTAFFNYFDMINIFIESGFEMPMMHVRGLQADLPPPLWVSVAKYPNAALYLSYADLVFSCQKPHPVL